MLYKKKDQDIVEAMSLVELTKERLQLIRNDGWETHLRLTTYICEKMALKFLRWKMHMFLEGEKNVANNMSQTFIIFEMKFFVQLLIYNYKN